MKTVLVVDDEFDLVEVLILALQDEGYQVFAAADGRHGVARAAAVRPHLVLVDYMMPRMDGPAMVAALRADPAQREIPIVIMSAVAETVVRERVTGYAAFLRKPFRIGTVLDLVIRLIGPGAGEDKG
jgi:CheY-like chemotaxis protein